jgi:hypothetical protein
MTEHLGFHRHMQSPLTLIEKPFERLMSAVINASASIRQVYAQSLRSSSYLFMIP